MYLCVSLATGWTQNSGCSPVHTHPYTHTGQEGKWSLFTWPQSRLSVHKQTHTHAQMYSLSATFFSLAHLFVQRILINLNTAPVFPCYLFEQLSVDFSTLHNSSGLVWKHTHTHTGLLLLLCSCSHGLGCYKRRPVTH